MQRRDNDSSTTYREVATLFDHSEVVDALFAQAGSNEHAAEATTHDAHFHFLHNCLALHWLHVGVVEIVS